MISMPLLKRDLKVGFKPFLVIFAVMCMYTVVIIYMYNPELADMMNGYQEALPGMMSAVGMTGIAGNLLEWIQIYLYGFIMILFPLLFLAVLTGRLLMGDIDRGSMANLLSTPNSRGKIIRTQMLAIVLWTLFLMVMVTVSGLLASELFFPGELDWKRYMLLNASTFLMQSAVAGIAFFVACTVSESKQFYLIGTGLPILFFLFQMLGNLGGKLENLKYVTIYTLLPAADIVAGNSGIWQRNLAMALLAAALLTGGALRFQRRDLSL